MDRRNNNKRAGRRKRACFGFCLAFLSAQALAAGIEVDGASNTTFDAAPNGVPVVNIANPNATGLSHNTYRRFNVDSKGLILNNANQSVVDTQLGGKIFGNSQLIDPARVILNEVTSTHRSLLEGYTEVAGQRADVVIANPNGISINGAGFINVPRVTLTTGLPQLDVLGGLTGFDVRGGGISIGGAGLDTGAQDATSIYTHFLELNARLHAKDLDILLGPNVVDYPGRKITSTRAGTAGRVVLDSSVLGGMYAGKIKLVGTDKGLGMHLPPEVIASSGDIEVTNDGRIVLRQLDAAGDIAIASSEDVESGDTVYGRAAVRIDADGAIRIDDGMVAARSQVWLAADRVDHAAGVVAGLEPDGGRNGWGELAIDAATIDNRGELVSTNLLTLDAIDVVNSGLVSAGGLLRVNADTLTNDGTLFSDARMNLFVSDLLDNRAGASIYAVGDLTLAADTGGAKTALIRNDLGLIQTFGGDIEIHAGSFDNLGFAEIDYDLIYFDLGNEREVPTPGAAMTIDLRYSSGYTKHKSTARRRWVNEVLSRLSRQAPALYADNEGSIRNLSARFDAIETRLVDRSTTDPALLDSGGNLTLDVDAFNNRDSIVSASGDIHLEVSGSYANQASGDPVRVTDYQYFTRAEHSRNSWSEDKYSSRGSRSGYAAVSRTRAVASSTVTQASGDLTGTVGGRAANDGTVLTGRHESQPGVSRTAVEPSSIALPSDDFGLFVRSPDPDSAYLIETNPRFTRFSDFIGSGYLLERLDYSAGMTLKRLGDAFYESKLIRDSVFAQTGRRYLDASIASDIAQFQYLMDNALAAQRDLELAPGVALDSEQINRLTRDIVWLEPREIDGERVLVPRVYLANSTRDPVRGGRIIGGGNIALQVAELANGGLFEAGGDFDLDVATVVSNTGVVAAGGALEVSATGKIENVSGRIEGAEVVLTSTGGDIVNRRSVETSRYSARDLELSTTVLGEAGVIAGRDSVSLEAAGAVRVEGSSIEGGTVRVEAGQVAIDTAIETERFDSGDDDDYLRESSLRHVASTVVGDEIIIFSAGDARLRGSSLDAAGELRIEAGAIDIAGANDNSYLASQSSLDGLASERVDTKRRYRSVNRESELGGAIVVLVTEQGDIELTGSHVRAGTRLVLDSADDIRIDAGQDGSLDERRKYKSSWFGGNSLYSEEDELDGRVAETAVRSSIEAGEVEMTARGDIALTGVDAAIAGGFGATAQKIEIANATSEETIYSKHTRVNLGFDDVVSNLGELDEFIDEEDGKLKLRLGEAAYEHAESVTTSTTAVASQIAAGNIALTADGDAPGDIRVEGSDLYADGTIALDATGDVALLDAEHTREHEALTQTGTAAVNVTLQNEFDQLARALKAVRGAERDLRHARDAFDDYESQLARQEAAFRKLQRDYDRGIGFIERADLDDFERRLERLRDDEAFYETNIAFAAATLATRTTQALKQGGRAASSAKTLGFNAGIELDIDALERQVGEFYRESRATTLAGTSIDIRAGDTAAVRGSVLEARERIDIVAEDIEILAGASETRGDRREQHLNYTHSWDALELTSAQFGVPESVGGLDEDDLGGSISGDGSISKNESTVHANSRLTAVEIRLQAEDDTRIRGAEIHATDRLEIETGNLEVVSVQDDTFDETRSLGLSYSGAGAGLNAGDGDSETRRTVVTRVTGGQVAIGVHDHTEIRGAVIASIDADGHDRGELTLETNTLSAGSLNNTVDNENRSLGVNAGEFSSLDYADDAESERTKSLATLGDGTILIGDAENSDTRFLNNDLENTEVSVYEIESLRALSGELDTRLLTELGRDMIYEDWLRTAMLADAVKLIVTDERLGIADLSEQTDIPRQTLEAIKQVVASDAELAAALQIPDLTPEQKEWVTGRLTGVVMFALGYEAYVNNIVSTTTPGRDGEQVLGFYSTETGEAYLNDLYHDDMRDLVTAAGHEATRAMDDQSEVDFDQYREARQRYADHFGENFARYTEHALDLTGYDEGMARANNHIGAAGSHVEINNEVFIGLDKTQGDNYLSLSDKKQFIALVDALDDCRTNGNCSEQRIEEMRVGVTNLNLKDIDTTEIVELACRRSKSSDSCRAEIAKLRPLVIEYRSIAEEGDLAAGLGSEFIEIGALYGENLSEAMSENARRAIAKMPVDAASGAYDLALIAANAAMGDEQARHQMAILSEALQAFIANPVSTIDRGIKSQIEEAARQRALGNFNLAEQIESRLYVEGMLSITGVAVGASSLLRVGIDIPKVARRNLEPTTPEKPNTLEPSVGFRELIDVGAAVSNGSLPDGYRFVSSPNGDLIILGPNNGKYDPTDYIDLTGNTVYGNSKRLYVFSNGEIKQVKVKEDSLNKIGSIRVFNAARNVDGDSTAGTSTGGEIVQDSSRNISSSENSVLRTQSVHNRTQEAPHRELNNRNFNKAFATDDDKAIFWSGIGRDGSHVAARYARTNGGVTLESTIADRNIELPSWDPTDPSSVAAWRQASREFAMGARGHVRVLQGNRLRTNPIWGEVEFPALKENPNVESITSVDLETGTEVLLWSR